MECVRAECLWITTRTMLDMYTRMRIENINSLSLKMIVRACTYLTAFSFATTFNTLRD